MPIYENRCNQCETIFTHLSKVDDRNSEQQCPDCGSTDTELKVSATKTNFKFADKSAIKRVR